MTGLLQLLRLLAAGYSLVQLPGVPVEIIPCDSGFAVACTEPGSLHMIHAGKSHKVVSMELSDPSDLVFWNGFPAVSDREDNSVVLEDTLYNLPGSPEGICQVDWLSCGVPQLAVCLFDTGQVMLLDSHGEMHHLADVQGAKDVVSFDADSDGDQDLVVSGCGTGLSLLENSGSGAVVHWLGTIGPGVKRICLTDLDSDGNTDVAGIACAEGGAGWWRNPGVCTERWEYTEINGKLIGPKDISSCGDSLVVASLYSPVYTNYGDSLNLPAGFTCCFLQQGGSIVLGHSLGFVGIPWTRTAH